MEFLVVVTEKMYTTIPHELHRARKAWPGTLVDPCLLFGGENNYDMALLGPGIEPAQQSTINVK
jgi:hypothetical protein